MNSQYLYDVDEIQRLIVEYGTADSPEETEFPSGPALLASLLRLHCETDGTKLVEHIERVIEAVQNGTLDVAEFKVRPLPYAAWFKLLGYADSFEGRDIAICQYFRLRAFEQMGTFDDKALLRARGTEENPIKGLTDEEQDYLKTL